MSVSNQVILMGHVENTKDGVVYLRIGMEEESVYPIYNNLNTDVSKGDFIGVNGHLETIDFKIRVVANKIIIVRKGK